MQTGEHVYFYELHEGDGDLYSDALLTHEREFTADEFFELVQETRRRVQDTFEEDTLVEAIAHELERSHGFTYVSDALLVAAVNVSRIEEENYLAAVDGGDGAWSEDEEDEEDEGAEDGDDDLQTGPWRTAILDLDRERPN